MALIHSLRFLRRLEQALKERDKLLSDSCPDADADDGGGGSDVMDSPKATSPLLAATSSSSGAKPKNAGFKFSRQKRISTVYSFEPADRGSTFVDKDFLSD